MKMTIEYTGTLEEKTKAARQDIIGYLGEEKYKELLETIARDWHVCASFREFALNVGFFLGIEGFPVKIFFWDMLEAFENTLS